MSFEKKIWLNVPDENNPPEIPEGQEALARFDADNMNRIEEGIQDNKDEISKEKEESRNFTNDSIQKLVDAINNSPIALNRDDTGNVLFETVSLLPEEQLFWIYSSQMPTSGEKSIEFKLKRPSNYHPYKSYLSLNWRIEKINVGSAGAKGSVKGYVLDEDGNVVVNFDDKTSSAALSPDKVYILRVIWDFTVLYQSSSSMIARMGYTPVLQEHYATSQQIVI